MLKQVLRKYPDAAVRHSLLNEPLNLLESLTPFFMSHESAPPEEDTVTPLLLASHNGHTKSAKYLIQMGASPVTACRALSPLYVACRRGHMDIVLLVIAPPLPATERADPIAPSPNGSPPLLVAAGGGHLHIVKYLVEVIGADVQTMRYILPVFNLFTYYSIGKTMVLHLYG